MTMCWILGVPWWTKTLELLEKVNWLSIYQLAWYHSLILVWKVLSNKYPVNNYNNLTRKKLNAGRLKLTRRIWSVRAGQLYQVLPEEIRNTTKLSTAKLLLKTWIRSNIPVEEEEE